MYGKPVAELIADRTGIGVPDVEFALEQLPETRSATLRDES
jgi:hypothetical protein